MNLVIVSSNYLTITLDEAKLVQTQSYHSIVAIEEPFHLANASLSKCNLELYDFLFDNN